MLHRSVLAALLPARSGMSRWRFASRASICSGSELGQNPTCARWCERTMPALLDTGEGPTILGNSRRPSPQVRRERSAKADTTEKVRPKRRYQTGGGAGSVPALAGLQPSARWRRTPLTRECRTAPTPASPARSDRVAPRRTSASAAASFMEPAARCHQPTSYHVPALRRRSGRP
jgi:hypothetical protein